MTTPNIVNQSPFLRATREFPSAQEELLVEIDRSYVDIANAVNNRTIGIYTENRPSATGNSWFIDRKQRKQTQRQIYTFTAAGNISHGIGRNGGFIQIYGTFTDGSIWYPLPYVNTTAASQVSLHVTSTNIVITAGGSAPTITSGYVVLEWLIFSPTLT